jgi:hypothetical protein
LLKELGKMRSSGLFAPEEDEFLFLHIFSSVFLYVFFPFDDDFRSLMWFDRDLPHEQRRRMMKFYRQCIQRHLRVFGNGRQYLAKSPSFSARVNTIREHFPDAKLIYMVRTPLEEVPSLISLLSYYFKLFGSPCTPKEAAGYICEIVGYWYRHPLHCFEKMPYKQTAIVPYLSFVSDPVQVVLDMYGRLKLTATMCFRNILCMEQAKARQYQSQHMYSLEGSGLIRSELVSNYEDIIERFGFSPTG